MKELSIKRMTPNSGVVVCLDVYGEPVIVTPEKPYKECVEYVRMHQEELTVYKIGRILPRKNARRTLFKRIYALDEDEAKDIFVDICASNDDGSRLQLLTGDWKLIAERHSNGLIQFI